MKKILPFAILVLIFILTSCNPQKTLYSWGDYQQKSYAYLKNSSDENLEKLIKSYEDLINKQKGSRQTIPPGICADYGYLLVTKGEQEKGIEFLKREIALYPESTVFISRIIKKLEE